MTDMISEVARAIAERNEPGLWDRPEGLPDEFWRGSYLGDANAAIKAHEKALEAKGLVIVPREPNVASIANGVQFLIDANLDGPDGVGHSDALGCWQTMLAALEPNDDQ